MATFSPETRAFLSAIDSEGGAANTRQIRNRTQLTEGQLQYQFRKLNEAGYIEIEYSEWGSTSNAPIKVAHLTEKTRRAIDNEALDSTGESRNIVEVDMVELVERVDRIESRLTTLDGQEAERQQKVESEINNGQTQRKPVSDEDEGISFARRMGLLPEN